MSNPIPKYCIHCGSSLNNEFEVYPKKCTSDVCGEYTWLNPIPAANLIIPCDNGVLMCRRGIDPGYGELGIPGGYMDRSETWEQCASREAFEETGIFVPIDDIKLFAVVSEPPSPLVVFGASRRVFQFCDLPEHSDPETLERLVVNTTVPCAFKSHETILEAFFSYWKGDVTEYLRVLDNRWIL